MRRDSIAYMLEIVRVSFHLIPSPSHQWMRFSGGVTVSAPLIFGNFLRGMRKNGLFTGGGGAVMVLLIFSSKGNSQLTSSKGGVRTKWNVPVGVGRRGGGGR